MYAMYGQTLDVHYLNLHQNTHLVLGARTVTSDQTVQTRTWLIFSQNQAMTSLANSLLFHTIEMSIFYVLSFQTRNFGMVDFGWPLGFTLSAVYFYAISSPKSLINHVLTLGYILCGARFMYGWWMRHGGGKEDHRWQLWRDKWGKGQYLMIPFSWVDVRNIRMNQWVFYMLQAWANALFLTAPLEVLATCSNSVNYGMGWSWVQSVGVILYVLGFGVENVADMQLNAFKRRHAGTRSGKVCQEGLWAYSRHPNYFGEWLIWLGYTVYALPLAQRWMDVVRVGLCPVVAYGFLVYLTGIPITEEASCKRRPEYRQYQQRVPAFFPRVGSKKSE